MRYRDEIDGLRALAIVSVILFHSGAGLFSGGYVGVDIFFVISGYLITRIIADELREGRFTFAAFYARRARRILPALFFMTVIVTVACLIILLPPDLYKYGKILVYTAVFGANFRLAAERGYFDEEAPDNPLLHMWSLSVEEQFYLAWPLLLLLILRTRRVGLVVPALFAASFFISVALVHWMPRSAFYHLPSRGWELLTGATLALGLIPAPGSRRLAQTLSLAGLAMMVLPVFLLSSATPFPGLAALPPTLGCGLVIYAATAHRTAVSTLLSRKPILCVGKISYSLYLWHWPLIALPSYVLLRELTPAESSLAIGLAISIAILSWRFVERPFRRPCPRTAAPNPAAAARSTLRPNRRAYQGFAIGVILIACGTYIQQSHGMRWRLTPQALSAAAQGHGFQLETFCSSHRRSKNNLYECDWGQHRSGQIPVIVWGDSHADHYLPALVEVFSSGKFFMTSSCPPVTLTDRSPVFTNNIRNCAENNIGVLRTILDERPATVVLASVWTRFAFSAAYTAELQAYIKAMTNELSRAGVHVLILGQVPAQSGRSIRCEGMRLYLGTGNEHCGRIERAQAERSDLSVVQALTAAENKHVRYYSPMDVFCDKTYCYASRAGRWLYADGHHLNAEGGLLTTETIRAAAAALNASAQSAEAPMSGTAPLHN